ncbi:MAG: polysaccharide deacetylase family protein [Dehalococcoidia bacterium]|jgi:alpha-amylase/alpha-mannosidase (GH57 family)
MYWANFLHIYQPPTQTEEGVRKAAGECYRKLVDILSRNQCTRITLNINASLTEQLDRYGLRDVIDGLRRLAERGQIELTASAMYHPILPLLPRSEMVRQIKLNTEVNRKYFGDAYKPSGFFPPEMCYSKDVAHIVADLGYRWIIIDEISINGRLGNPPCDKIYHINGLKDFYAFFRERAFSQKITQGMYQDVNSFIDALGERTKRHEYLLTGSDGEAYGCQRPGLENLLSDIYKSRAIGTCTISDLMIAFKHMEAVDPLPSSENASEEDMAKGAPYRTWQDAGNELHKLQWQLTNLAIDAISSTEDESAQFRYARNLLDQGLYSGQFRGAGCRPVWDPDMIDRGVRMLMECIITIKEKLPKDVLDQAQELQREIKNKALQWQYSGEVDRRRESYRISHPMMIAAQS